MGQFSTIKFFIGQQYIIIDFIIVVSFSVLYFRLSFFIEIPGADCKNKAI